MRVLITGAAGLLGVELASHMSDRHDVTAVDREVDVTDARAVDACVDALGPDAVFHCAAWTDVDGAEDHEAAARVLNRDGARNVARACDRAGAALIYPSTDYVFDGNRGAPYREDDATGPLNVYGRTKLEGELAVREACPYGARIVRTAWLYGAAKGTFVETIRERAAEQEAVRVVHDQIGCPTWTRELAPALVTLLECPPGTYHAAAAGAVSWAGLARRVIERLHLDCDVVPISTAESGRRAQRPAYSALATTRLDAPRLRRWDDALDDYLEWAP
ncbi:MAG: dTDP-4-dehydrorhamnose reductase [Thermoleophilia bacterium]|nr:dTDP-4-dehydrorhamnose reductase [Thermoleophilia bacterium]